MSGHRGTPAEHAAPTVVVERALRRVSAWAPDLDPDDRYGPLAGPGGLDLVGVADGVRRRLPGAPERVTWSAVVMGVASRFWSVSVVPFVADGVLVDPGCVLARHDDGAVTLGVREPRGWAGAGVDDLDRVLRGVVEPLVAEVATRSLAPRLLWGNVAASLHAVPRVHDLPAALDVVEALLAGPGLAGALDVRPEGTARRRTCCLFYLVPGAGLCGDCVLDTVPGPPG